MAGVSPSAIEHTPARAQGWPEVDDDIGAWVEHITGSLAAILGGALVGLYLHGSLATASYDRPASDSISTTSPGSPMAASTSRRSMASSTPAGSSRC